jgi:hypothetical protein
MSVTEHMVADMVVIFIYNEEHHILYSSPNVIRIIRSRRMKLAGHVARMEERKISIELRWKIRK